MKFIGRLFKKHWKQKLVATLLLLLIFIYAALFAYSSDELAGIEQDKLKVKKYYSLSKLSAEVQISYFNKLLGEPVYINYSEDNLREYIYVDPHFYVQAITDDHDKVQAYSVTSRKYDFNPVLKVMDKTIQLNNISYAQARNILSNPLLCYYTLGNRYMYYFEEYYLGNPGLYQTYLIGNNTAGDSTFDFPVSDGEDLHYLDNGGYDCGKVSERTVSNSTPNTYIVISQRSQTSKLFNNFTFGVDEDQVRTLNE